MNVTLNSIKTVKHLYFSSIDKLTSALSSPLLKVIFLLAFAISGFYSQGQIQVSVIPPSPMSMSPCQGTPFYLKVKNAGTSSQNFALTIALGQDQSIDTSSLTTLPSGFNDSIVIDPLTGYPILKIFTSVALPAGVTDTFAYTIRGVGCAINASLPLLSQTLNITNVNGTVYSGAGGYQISFAPASSSYTFSYNNATPNLTPVTSTIYGIVDSLATGQQGTFRVLYVNSGTAAYNGAISLGLNFPCLDSGNVTINSLNVYVRDTTPSSLIASITGPVPASSFPMQICNLNIDTSTLLLVEMSMTVSPNSCIGQSGCTAQLNLKWGCSTPCINSGSAVYCHNNDSTPIPLYILPKPTPFDLRMMRILPLPATGSPFPWEATCHGSDSTHSENEWKFLVQNDGLTPVSNIQIQVRNEQYTPGITNTMIRSKSVHINQPDTSLHISTPVGGVTSTILKYKDADFNGTNPYSCYRYLRDTLYPGDTAVKSITINIPVLAAGQKMVVDFKTYRCCAWDNQPNNGVYYNHWGVYATFGNPCPGSAYGVNQYSTSYVTEPGFTAPLLIDTPNNIYGYSVWTTWQAGPSVWKMDNKGEGIPI
jgi:hypothetical protein